MNTNSKVAPALNRQRSVLSGLGLIKEALDKNGYAVLPYRGMSMCPTLREKMMVRLNKTDFASLKPADIIAYSQDEIIAIHRLISILSDKGSKMLVAKGDNQPFGGISYVGERQLLARAESAFYENAPEKNLLRNKWLNSTFYLFMGRLFLFYDAHRLFFPGLVKNVVKCCVRLLYSIFGKYQENYSK